MLFVIESWSTVRQKCAIYEFKLQCRLILAFKQPFPSLALPSDCMMCGIKRICFFFRYRSRAGEAFVMREELMAGT